jgi:uncharacterized membrane protein YuzA (DUF378 family)
MKALHVVAWILLIVGGLNWLLAAFGVDLATWSEASIWATVLKVVYVLVGLSAVLELVTHRKTCKHCEAKDVTPTPAV